MFRTIIVMAIGTIALTAVACASGVRRGVVAMKLSKSEAHVSLGRSEVAPGDRVTLYRNLCQPRTAPRKGLRVECEKRRIGEGRIAPATIRV